MGGSGYAKAGRLGCKPCRPVPHIRPEIDSSPVVEERRHRHWLYWRRLWRHVSPESCDSTQQKSKKPSKPSFHNIFSQQSMKQLKTTEGIRPFKSKYCGNNAPDDFF